MHRKLLIGIFFIIFAVAAGAQTTPFTQWSNELQLTRTINERWAAEVYLGGTFSNTPTESRVLKTNIQRYVVAWGHYFLNPRWKLSSGLAYYYNKDVPDIGQYFSPEYRLSLQGIYFIHKTGYTLSTRMRGEFRYMMNADSVYEDNYRYRQMIRYMQPINGKILRQGVFYFVTSEELLFKPNAKTAGVTFFDRNRFELGAGYLITDNLQLELTYANEFIPRDNGNDMYHIVSLTITVNNLVENIKSRITGPSGDQVPD